MLHMQPFFSGVRPISYAQFRWTVASITVRAFQHMSPVAQCYGALTGAFSAPPNYRNGKADSNGTFRQTAVGHLLLMVQQ